MDTTFRDNIEVMKEDGTQFKILEHDVAGAVVSDVQFLSAAEYSKCVLPQCCAISPASVLSPLP